VLSRSLVWRRACLHERPLLMKSARAVHQLHVAVEALLHEPQQRTHCSGPRSVPQSGGLRQCTVGTNSRSSR
jgi:hypothetical protein